MTLPPVPETGRAEETWAQHIAAYQRMAPERRAEWFGTLSEDQQKEFSTACAQATATVQARPWLWKTLIGLGVVLGLVVNIVLGAFLILAGVGLWFLERNK
jgi:hypothetical protein